MELAESVIAVVQIAEKVLHACTSYMFAVRGAWEDIERLRAKVQDLSNDLTILKKSIRRNGEMGPWTTKMIAGTLLECSLDLEDLGRQMKPGKLQSVMKKFGKAVLKWPFSSTDVDKIVATLERHKLTINLAVNIVSNFKRAWMFAY